MCSRAPLSVLLIPGTSWPADVADLTCSVSPPTHTQSRMGGMHAARAALFAMHECMRRFAHHQPCGSISCRNPTVKTYAVHGHSRAATHELFQPASQPGALTVVSPQQGAPRALPAERSPAYAAHRPYGTLPCCDLPCPHLRTAPHCLQGRGCACGCCRACGAQLGGGAAGAGPGGRPTRAGPWHGS